MAHELTSGDIERLKRQYRGVFWDRKTKRWRCQLGFQSKKIFLGYFDDPCEAARAYDQKLVELRGPAARTNFPITGYLDIMQTGNKQTAAVDGQDDETEDVNEEADQPFAPFAPFAGQGGHPEAAAAAAAAASMAAESHGGYVGESSASVAVPTAASSHFSPHIANAASQILQTQSPAVPMAAETQLHNVLPSITPLKTDTPGFSMEQPGFGGLHNGVLSSAQELELARNDVLAAAAQRAIDARRSLDGTLGLLGYPSSHHKQQQLLFHHAAVAGGHSNEQRCLSAVHEQLAAGAHPGELPHAGSGAVSGSYSQYSAARHANGYISSHGYSSSGGVGCEEPQQHSNSGFADGKSPGSHPHLHHTQQHNQYRPHSQQDLAAEDAARVFQAENGVEHALQNHHGPYEGHRLGSSDSVVGYGGGVGLNPAGYQRSHRQEMLHQQYYQQQQQQLMHFQHSHHRAYDGPHAYSAAAEHGYAGRLGHGVLAVEGQLQHQHHHQQQQHGGHYHHHAPGAAIYEGQLQSQHSGHHQHHQQLHHRSGIASYPHAHSTHAHHYVQYGGPHSSEEADYAAHQHQQHLHEQQLLQQQYGGGLHSHQQLYGSQAGDNAVSQALRQRLATYRLEGYEQHDAAAAAGLNQYAAHSSSAAEQQGLARYSQHDSRLDPEQHVLNPAETDGQGLEEDEYDAEAAWVQRARSGAYSRGAEARNDRRSRRSMAAAAESEDYDGNEDPDDDDEDSDTGRGRGGRNKRRSRAAGSGVSGEGGPLRTKQRTSDGTGLHDNERAHSYRGVFWDKKSRRWRCQLGHKNKKIFLGYFAIAEEAARAYDQKLVELHGSSAKTNFPIQSYLGGGGGSGEAYSSGNHHSVAATAADSATAAADSHSSQHRQLTSSAGGGLGLHQLQQRGHRGHNAAATAVDSAAAVAHGSQRLSWTGGDTVSTWDQHTLSSAAADAEESVAKRRRLLPDPSASGVIYHQQQHMAIGAADPAAAAAAAAVGGLGSYHASRGVISDDAAAAAASQQQLSMARAGSTGYRVVETPSVAAVGGLTSRHSTTPASGASGGGSGQLAAAAAGTAQGTFGNGSSSAAEYTAAVTAAPGLPPLPAGAAPAAAAADAADAAATAAAAAAAVPERPPSTGLASGGSSSLTLSRLESVERGAVQALSGMHAGALQSAGSGSAGANGGVAASNGGVVVSQPGSAAAAAAFPGGVGGTTGGTPDEAAAVAAVPADNGAVSAGLAALQGLSTPSQQQQQSHVSRLFDAAVSQYGAGNGGSNSGGGGGAGGAAVEVSDAAAAAAGPGPTLVSPSGTTPAAVGTVGGATPPFTRVPSVGRYSSPSPTPNSSAAILSRLGSSEVRAVQALSGLHNDVLPYGAAAVMGGTRGGAWGGHHPTASRGAHGYQQHHMHSHHHQQQHGHYQYPSVHHQQPQQHHDYQRQQQYHHTQHQQLVQPHHQQHYYEHQYADMRSVHQQQQLPQHQQQHLLQQQGSGFSGSGATAALYGSSAISIPNSLLGSTTGLHQQQQQPGLGQHSSSSLAAAAAAAGGGQPPSSTGLASAAALTHSLAQELLGRALQASASASSSIAAAAAAATAGQRVSDNQELLVAAAAGQQQLAVSSAYTAALGLVEHPLSSMVLPPPPPLQLQLQFNQLPPAGVVQRRISGTASVPLDPSDAVAAEAGWGLVDDLLMPKKRPSCSGSSGLIGLLPNIAQLRDEADAAATAMQQAAAAAAAAESAAQAAHGIAPAAMQGQPPQRQQQVLPGVLQGQLVQQQDHRHLQQQPEAFIRVIDVTAAATADMQAAPQPTPEPPPTATAATLGSSAAATPADVQAAVAAAPAVAGQALAAVTGTGGTAATAVPAAPALAAVMALPEHISSVSRATPTQLTDVPALAQQVQQGMQASAPTVVPSPPALAAADTAASASAPHAAVADSQGQPIVAAEAASATQQDVASTPAALAAALAAPVAASAAKTALVEATGTAA